MSNTNKYKSDVILDLSIDDDGFGFATSIDDALVQAEAELVVLNETVESIKELKPQCDKLDYILAASSGALCGIIDIFLVGKPGESPLGDITDKWFANRTMDFAKLCHPDKKEFNSLDSALRFLEKEFRVPYDQTGLGDAGRAVFDMNAKNHHFKALAHNPSLLGLFFSILDQFSNTSHFISDGQLISLQQADDKWEVQGGNVPSKLFCGFVNWFGHLMSERAISYGHAKRTSDFAAKEITIVENYIEGLKILSVKYDDARLLTFIADFKKSGAYIEAFGKSAQLAELRNVTANRVLKSKADIDRYFGGK